MDTTSHTSVIHTGSYNKVKAAFDAIGSTVGACPGGTGDCYTCGLVPGAGSLDFTIGGKVISVPFSDFGLAAQDPTSATQCLFGLKDGGEDGMSYHTMLIEEEKTEITLTNLLLRRCCAHSRSEHSQERLPGHGLH
jgi:hypothetical protein